MKKIILAFIVLGALSISSCSKDDDDGCLSCTYASQTKEVCKLINGNAALDGVDQGTNFDDYIAQVKKLGGSCQ